VMDLRNKGTPHTTHQQQSPAHPVKVETFQVPGTNNNNNISYEVTFCLTTHKNIFN
jgi:hypothetical protein